MLQSQPKTRLRILRWLAIILGSWLLIGSAVAIIGLIANGPPPDDLSQEEPFRNFPILIFMSNHYALVATLQLLFASLLIVSGFFLKARLWARTLLEALCWFCLVLLAAFAAQFLIWPKAMISVIGVVGLLVCCLPFAAAIYLLRNVMNSLDRAPNK